MSEAIYFHSKTIQLEGAGFEKTVNIKRESKGLELICQTDN